MFDKNRKGSPLPYDLILQDENIGEVQLEQMTLFDAVYGEPFTEGEINDAMKEAKELQKARNNKTGVQVVLGEESLRKKAYDILLQRKKPSMEDVIGYINYGQDPILVGCSLKWVRVRYFHISQEDMAEKMGVSRVYYTNLETGRNKMSTTARSRVAELCKDMEKPEFDSGVQMVIPDDMLMNKKKKHPAFRIDPPIYTADGKKYKTLKYAIAYESDWIPSLFVGVNDIVIYCPEITYGGEEDCFVMHDAINEKYFVGQIIVGTNEMGLPYVDMCKFASLMDIYEGKAPFEKIESGAKGIECLGRIVEVRKRFKPYKGNISINK